MKTTCERCEKKRRCRDYQRIHSANHVEFREFCASCYRAVAKRGWRRTLNEKLSHSAGDRDVASGKTV